MKSKNNKLFILPIVILILLIAFSVYLYNHNVVFVDSDAASELLFSNILSEQGGLLTNKWYYSTTISMVDYPMIYSSLFRLISNWLVVRVIGTTIVITLYLLSTYYLSSKLNIKNKWLLMILLLLPFSIVYFGMYLAMPYYAFTSIKIFMSLGAVLDLFSTENKNKKITLIVLVSILALIQGLEGIRNVVLFIVPLFLSMLAIVVFNSYKTSELSKWNKEFAILCCTIVVFCGVGYFVNSTLIAQSLEINNYVSTSFGVIVPETIIQEANSWLTVFGHSTGEVFSLNSVHNLLCYLIILLSTSSIIDNLIHYKNINKNIIIYTLYYSFAVLILIYFAVFIDINKMGLYDVSRYNLPIAVMAIPLIVEWLDRIYTKNTINKIIYILFILLFVVCGLDNYRLCTDENNTNVLAKINTGRVNNNTVELRNIAYMLKEDGYKNGYSYFWCGNVLTELSNGDIEMWVWAPGGLNTKELNDLNERYKWLQLKSHVGSHPEGKTFLIFNQDELDYSRITHRLDWKNVIYNSENFTVYAYDNHEELVKDFNN